MTRERLTLLGSAGPVAAVALTLLTLPGCTESGTTEREPTSGPAVPSVAGDLSTAVDTTVTLDAYAGEDRGVCFDLRAGGPDGEVVAVLESNKSGVGVRAPGSDCIAVGVDDDAPDVVALPQGLPPGAYAICPGGDLQCTEIVVE